LDGVMDDNNNVNAAILERLEKVVQSLQENSVKMGELLAVTLRSTRIRQEDTYIRSKRIQTLSVTTVVLVCL
jgi:hypothetical protein